MAWKEKSEMALEIGNKYGLTRGSLSAETKRKIRQSSGFGCVLCGLGIYQYEHVDPEFNEATEHDPEKMTLLCPGCHHKVTSKMVSKATVKVGMLRPKCKEVGYSREHFDIGSDEPYLKISGMYFKSTSIPILVKDTPLLQVTPGDAPGEPFRISGFFTDSIGKISLRIENNEWMARATNWDVEVIGPTIKIREGHGKVHLVLTADPPYGLIVTKISMFLHGFQFIGNETEVRIVGPNGGEMNFSGMATTNCRVGLSLS